MATLMPLGAADQFQPHQAPPPEPDEHGPAETAAKGMGFAALGSFGHALEMLDHLFGMKQEMGGAGAQQTETLAMDPRDAMKPSSFVMRPH